MKFSRLVASAAAVAAVAGCATNSKESKSVPDSALVAPHFKAWDDKTSSLMFANEEPLRFSSNVSAADKLFAVLGMPSLSTVKEKGIRNPYLRQATREQVLDAIRPATSPKAGYNNDGSLIAYNLIGGGIGAAGTAITVLGDATFDPRTKLGFAYCFGKKTETVDLNDAVQKCGEKVTGMVNGLFQPTTRVLDIGFGQVRAGSVQAGAVKKVGEIFIGTEAFATDGYAPQDRGGYAARIVAIPIQQKIAGGVGKMLGAELGEIGPVEWADLLKHRLPKDMAFYLPNGDQPVAVY
ncbi:hypothetical protein [Pseudomonas oryzihabitans]|uniref:DUF3313 domain-containing protein n=1 Tax=Pseudomonas oryzihabitans TaxID=47885 RepID=A0ABX3IS05_9PSED|nr:hypothetical protein [Pseudomonas psychrotolerans]ONN71142.1 hypothetical protein BVL52_11625 [Pseudomonas psychrotolerans]